jgi:hypothetical protein
MKDKMFNNSLGATAGCTLRLLLESIPQEKQGIKHGIHGDAWFGSVQTPVRVHTVAMKASFRSRNTIPFILEHLLRRHLKRLQVELILYYREQHNVRYH